MKCHPYFKEIMIILLMILICVFDSVTFILQATNVCHVDKDVTSQLQGGNCVLKQGIILLF